MTVRALQAPISNKSPSPAPGTAGARLAADTLILLTTCLLIFAVVLLFVGGLGIACLVVLAHCVVSLIAALRSIRPAIRRAPFDAKPSR